MSTYFKYTIDVLQSSHSIKIKGASYTWAPMNASAVIMHNHFYWKKEKKIKETFYLHIVNIIKAYNTVSKSGAF